jgi:DNA-binding MarR family transcriptional regulator
MPRFDIGSLDDVVHGRVRLGIMECLTRAGVTDFNDLKRILEVNQGNLSVHLRKLEDAGYIIIATTFENRRSLTRVNITESGRVAFYTYREAIAKLTDVRARLAGDW